MKGYAIDRIQPSAMQPYERLLITQLPALPSPAHAQSMRPQRQRSADPWGS